MDNHLENVDQLKNTLLELALQFGPKVIVATIIIVVGIYVGRWIGKLLEGGLKKFHLEAPVDQALRELSRPGSEVEHAAGSLGEEPVDPGVGVGRARGRVLRCAVLEGRGTVSARARVCRGVVAAWAGWCGHGSTVPDVRPRVDRRWVAFGPRPRVR